MSNVIANEIVTGDGGLIAAAKINADNVDFNKVGEYKATVTSGEYSLDFTVKVADTTAPVITLKSESVNVMKSGQVTADSFIESVDDKSSYTTGVIKDADASSPADDMQDSISYDTTGTYTIGVVAKDEYGNYDMKKVTVNVTDIDYSAILNSGVDVTIPAGTDFSQYKTDKVPYGFSTTDVDEHNRPGGCSYYDKLYGMYAADFIQPYSNYIYLTFDEGYEYGFTPSILDTLKEKGVKAVFFVTLPYAKDNPELVQRMIDEGHVIGNHTTTHPSGGLQQYSAQKQVDDINQVTQYIKENSITICICSDSRKDLSVNSHLQLCRVWDSVRYSGVSHTETGLLTTSRMWQSRFRLHLTDLTEEQFTCFMPRARRIPRCSEI